MALIPFVGPYFDYGFGANDTWVWHTSRLWMNVLPGAAIVIAGLVLLGLAERVTMAVGAWLGCVAGAWLVVAPAVSSLWNHNVSLTGRPLGGAHRQVFEYLGFYYGAGAVAMFLAATALGRLSVVGVRDVRPVAARAAARDEARPIATDPAAADVTGPTAPKRAEEDVVAPAAAATAEPTRRQPAKASSGRRRLQLHFRRGHDRIA